MQFLVELGLFSSKILITLIAIGALLILFFALLAKARQAKPLLSIENLNEKFDHMAAALRSTIFDSKELKAHKKEEKRQRKAEAKAKAKAKGHDKPKRNVYVLDFEGDLRASHVENLREEVTAVLTIARKDLDEVVIRVESPGGTSHGYGLAAAQLVRIRNAGIQLTVCVDKVAASGGYMMACTGHRILASPFAVVGSIGVVAQVANVHRLLKKHDVDVEEMTAGEFKRTVSFMGEITEKGKQKLLEQIEEIHVLFKQFVHTYRPQLNIDEVATGEFWAGTSAKDKRLVDEIISSDDYLFGLRNEANIYKIEVQSHKKWSEKLAENLTTQLERSFERLIQRFSIHF